MEKIKCFFCDSPALKKRAEDLSMGWTINREGDCPQYRITSAPGMEQKLRRLSKPERDRCSQYLKWGKHEKNFLFSLDNLDHIKKLFISDPKNRI